MNKVRKPAVQGRFYSSDRKELLSNIDALERYSVPETQLIGENCIIGGIAPHAAHIYSGPHTIPLFRIIASSKQKFETIIIVNPNHSGVGPAIALDPHDSWQNALGHLQIDQALNSLLPYPADATPQEREHSAEVIIPFIQYYFKEDAPRILPICMYEQSAKNSQELAENLYIAIQQTGRKVLILASSDFSHFLSPETGFKHDELAVEKIMERDIRGLEKVVIKNRLSICGYGPIMTLMAFASRINPTYETTILARGHSGEAYPSKEVVDYISMLFHFIKK